MTAEGIVSALGEARRARGDAERPFVTLSYAQSLDGCISSSRHERLSLSGREAFELTHTLRAMHDAICIGIGTVLTDDPLLTVRYVEGSNPRPVIVDAELRFPPGSRLITENPLSPWIFTTAAADAGRRKTLEAAGARIIEVPAAGAGLVDAKRCLETLHAEGIGSVMVEGGAAVITTMLSWRLVDVVVVTIAPLIIGGLHAVGALSGPAGERVRELRLVRHERLGEDLVLVAESPRDA
jgi:3,4-dihydroxy 2-butanone 4-phosphate synthase/GTP cyclohydrolase II